MPKYTIEFQDELEFLEYAKAKERNTLLESTLNDVHQIARGLNKHGGTPEEFENAIKKITDLSYPLPDMC